MIYTITFSPSIDLFLDSKNNFNPKGLTRYENFSLLAGGKGINASILLSRLNTTNQALTFFSGDISKIIEKQLLEEKVNYKNFGSINQTRINLKYNDDINNFEINGPKSKISEEQLNNFYLHLSNELKPKDIVMIMGVTDFSVIKKIISIVKDKKAEFVLDIDNPKVIDILSYKPLVFKPNKDELEMILKTKINSKQELDNAANLLLNKGVQNLIISCGSEGSFYYNQTQKYRAIFKPLKIVNSAGAGDSMLAGFVHSLVNNKNNKEAFMFANACGMATVSSKWIGTKQQIGTFIKQIEIN